MILHAQTFLVVAVLILTLSQVIRGALRSDLIEHSGYDEAKIENNSSSPINKGDLSRIINGIDDDVSNYPWMARIIDYDDRSKIWKHACGGALIHQNFVLTAAHCFVTAQRCDGFSHKRSRFISVMVENNTWSNEELEINIHPEFDDCHMDGDYINIRNDIALIHLKPKPDIPPLVTIKLPDHFKMEYFGTTGIIIGWGWTHFSKKYPSNKLQKIDVGIFPGTHDSCRYWFPYQYEIESTICLVSRSYQGPCDGDSGSPLFVHQKDGSDVLIGLTSWVGQFCDTTKPSIYTRVFYYVRWIERMMERYN